MKKAISILFIVLFAVGLVGCSKYASHYNAIAFVHSNEKDSAFMEFYRFDGTMVFTLHGGSPCTLHYTAKLETGSATVYYDCGQGKTTLLTIGAGDALENTVTLSSGGTVYVIVETGGQCENGAFHFDLP